MTPYRVFVDTEAARLTRNLTKTERDKLDRAIDTLATDPFQKGDFTLRDDVGRPYEVKRIGIVWIYYWADHGNKEVKVFKIEPRSRTR